MKEIVLKRLLDEREKVLARQNSFTINDELLKFITETNALLQTYAEVMKFEKGLEALQRDIDNLGKVNVDYPCSNAQYCKLIFN